MNESEKRHLVTETNLEKAFKDVPDATEMLKGMGIALLILIPMFLVAGSAIVGLAFYYRGVYFQSHP